MKILLSLALLLLTPAAAQAELSKLSKPPGGEPGSYILIDKQRSVIISYFNDSTGSWITGISPLEIKVSLYNLLAPGSTDSTKLSPASYDYIYFDTKPKDK